MAKSVTITSEKGAFQLTIDGQEVKDVISYQLANKVESVPTLTLKIAILGSIAAKEQC